MKLLLTSAGLKNRKISDFFISILSKEPERCSVIMIAYIQNSDEQFYVDESKKELSDLGIDGVTFFNLKEKMFDDEQHYDVIYVCGGNTFSILDRMRVTGVDRFIWDSAKDKDTVYLGVSAGGIIAGPSIEIAGWGSEGDKNEVDMKNLNGLGLTNQSIFPHFRPELEQEVNDFKRRVNYPVIKLTNDEAAFIQNSKCHLI